MHHEPWGREAQIPTHCQSEDLLTTVSRVPAISQMEKTYCFYPITHWGYSDGGRVLDQNQENKNKS